MTPITIPSIPSLTTRGKQLAAMGAVVYALGLGSGWMLWRPKPAPVETAQPAVRQKDSSLVLQRAPDAKAKPAAIVPKGETVARIVRVEVQGPTQIVHDTIQVPATTGTTPPREIAKVDTVACDPVKVELTLTDLKDGTHRVVASSPTGRILGSSIDIPVKNTAPPRTLPWSVGALYGSQGQLGPYLGRDVGPVRVTAGFLGGGKAPGRALVGVGLRF